MSKPVVLALLVGVLAAASVPAIPRTAAAADLAIPFHRIAAAHWCGSCGCLHASYVYHRELRSTFGIGFDPRNYDMTEPHYYAWAGPGVPPLLGRRQSG